MTDSSALGKEQREDISPERETDQSEYYDDDSTGYCVYDPALENEDENEEPSEESLNIDRSELAH